VAAPDGDTPSVAQIIVGDDSTDTDAFFGTGAQSASVDTPLPFDFTGLTQGTEYDVWCATVTTGVRCATMLDVRTEGESGSIRDWLLVV
jgi:hypothetical protein